MLEKMRLFVREKDVKATEEIKGEMCALEYVLGDRDDFF